MRIIILVAIALIAAGCSTPQGEPGWRVVSLDGPWIAANEAATVETRTYYRFMDAGASSKSRFVSTSGASIDTDHITRRYFNYLGSSGELEDWPLSQSRIGSVTQRISPYILYLVSVRPTVVLMIPKDPTVEKDYITGGFSILLEDNRVIGQIRGKQVIPYRPEIYWSSPDLKVRKAKIEWTSTEEFSLDLGRTTLTGTSDGSVIRILRH